MQVAGNREAGAAFFLDQRDHLLCVRLLGGQIVDGDIGAFTRICDRSGAAHARIAAGDQRLAAGEPPGALVAGLAVIGTRLHLAGEAGPALRLLLERRFRIAGDGVDQVLLSHIGVSFRC